ncbi:sugar phosphate nucleotidyltransferase [Novosphingobium sp. MW5]|nr:sugar phosphate nucleotidyltransferase [Novosphingobium sp. MW5]
MIHPVLLCGGSGTRLWPLSRKSYPKQFSSLVGDASLFQTSAQRLSGDGFAQPVVVTGSDFRFIVTEQLTSAEVTPRHPDRTFGAQHRPGDSGGRVADQRQQSRRADAGGPLGPCHP